MMTQEEIDAFYADEHILDRYLLGCQKAIMEEELADDTAACS